MTDDTNQIEIIGGDGFIKVFGGCGEVSMDYNVRTNLDRNDEWRYENIGMTAADALPSPREPLKPSRGLASTRRPKRTTRIAQRVPPRPSWRPVRALRW
jgi:hypothetical protein